MTQGEAPTGISEAVAQAAAKIKTNIEKVLVGKGDVIDLTLAAILSGGHVLVEDVPGIGKTNLRCTPSRYSAHSSASSAPRI
jgi:MoxR-like ATPase